MIKINFYLKKITPNKKGLVPLFGQIVFKSKNYRTTVGFIKPSEWNANRNAVKLPQPTHEKYAEYVGINQRIELLRRATTDLQNKVTAENRKAAEEEIRQLLMPDEDLTKTKVTPDFFELFDKYIETQSTLKPYNSIKGIRTVRNFLERFQKGSKPYTITVDKIDTVFAEKLIHFCFQKNQIDNDYFVKIVSVLNTFLKWAKKPIGFELNFPEELGKIKEKTNDVVFLSQEELAILYNFEFPLERHDKVRDLFCFACFTGLRHCDVIKLTHESISNGFISQTMEKTQIIVKIPLSKFALQILKKHKDGPTPLPIYSSQNCNDYIKECLAIIADKQEHPDNELFNRKVRHRKVSGKKVTQTISPMKDAITFHIGRKTFITNSLMLGINLQALQSMGAPKKQEHLKKYLAIVDAFKSQEMQNSWDKIDL